MRDGRSPPFKAACARDPPRKGCPACARGWPALAGPGGGRRPHRLGGSPGRPSPSPGPVGALESRAAAAGPLGRRRGEPVGSAFPSRSARSPHGPLRHQAPRVEGTTPRAATPSSRRPEPIVHRDQRSLGSARAAPERSKARTGRRPLEPSRAAAHDSHPAAQRPWTRWPSSGRPGIRSGQPLPAFGPHGGRVPAAGPRARQPQNDPRMPLRRTPSPSSLWR